jgi:hypothetical protein
MTADQIDDLGRACPVACWKRTFPAQQRQPPGD